METIVIRKARAGEARALWEIEAVCFPEAEAASLQSLSERLKIFGDWFFVAEDASGKAVGMINGMACDQRFITDDLYENASLHRKQGKYQMVFGLDVLPEYRGQHIAGMLMRAFVDASRKAGREAVELTCKDRLIGMYEYFGFEKLGVSGSVHGGAVWYDMEMKLR